MNVRTSRLRSYRPQAIAIFVLSVLALALPALASLSRPELEELANKQVSTAVILSLVEKHCVDFELDKATRRALAPQVDDAVLDAIEACRGTAGKLGEVARFERPVSKPPPPPPPGVERYAVPPLVVDGKVDLEITSLFLDALRRRVKPSEVIDPFTLGMHFGDPNNFNAGAPQDALAAAAARAGATAMVIGKAVTYKQFQDYAMRLDVKVIKIGDGDGDGDGGQSWRESGRGTSGNRSWTAAKKRAVIDTVRKLPTQLAGDR